MKGLFFKINIMCRDKRTEHNLWGGWAAAGICERGIWP